MCERYKVVGDFRCLQEMSIISSIAPDPKALTIIYNNDKIIL